MMNGISNAGSYYGYYQYAGYGRVNAAVRTGGANYGVPVEPVAKTAPVKPVMPHSQRIVAIGQASRDTIPFLREGADPAEMAVRMRMQTAEGNGVEAVERARKEGECQTCKERKYQDGSDDSGVSYQTPTHIAPEQAASAVRGHEREHVVREGAKAEREDRKVVSQSVTLHTGICPECGKVYISGGTTRTTTAAETKPEMDVFTQPEEKGFSAVA